MPSSGSNTNKQQAAKLAPSLQKMQKASGVITDNVSMASIGDENGSMENEDVKLSDIELETASNQESNGSMIH